MPPRGAAALALLLLRLDCGWHLARTSCGSWGASAVMNSPAVAAVQASISASAVHDRIVLTEDILFAPTDQLFVAHSLTFTSLQVNNATGALESACIDDATQQPRHCRLYSEPRGRVSGNDRFLPFFFTDNVFSTSDELEMTVTFEALEIHNAYVFLGGESTVDTYAAGSVFKAVKNLGFDLPPLQVHFHDCYVHHNGAHHAGGVVFSEAGETTVVVSGQSVFEMNSVEQDAPTVSNGRPLGMGGVFAAAGNLTVEVYDDASFALNSAPGGGVAAALGTLNLAAVDNASFVNNSADGASFEGTFAQSCGGVLYSETDLSLLARDQVLFDGNSGQAGGVACGLAGATNITVRDGCKFINNVASLGRGAVATCAGETCEIDVQGGSGEGSVLLASNAAHGEGGCFYSAVAFSAAFTLVNATLAYNSGSYGGALYMSPFVGSDSSGFVPVMQATFENVALRNNSATTGSGGALFVRGEIRVSNCTFEGNVAQEDGGAVFVDANSYLSINLTISREDEALFGSGGSISAGPYTSVSLVAVDFLVSRAGSYGGALALGSESSLSAIGAAFGECEATSGACIYIASLCEDVALDHVSVWASHGVLRGGFLYVGSESVVALSHVTGSRSTTDGYGGLAFMESDATLTIADSNVVSWSTNNGGCVALSARSALVVTDSFVMGTATTLGGLFYVADDGRLELHHVFARMESISVSLGPDTPMEPVIPIDGGCVYANIFSTIIITDSSFDDCASTHFGGAFFLAEYSNTTIDGLLVDKARAAFGGGMYVARAASLRQHDTTIRKCAAATAGGGIYLDGMPSLTDLDDLSIEECTAGEAPLPHLVHGASSTGDGLGLDDTVNAMDSAAAGSGGAIFLDDSAKVDLSGSVVLRGNSAARGGGVYVDQHAQLTGCTGCQLLDNAAISGGAVYVDANGHAILDHSALHNNSASVSGGAVYSEEGWCSLLNATLADNRAQQSGGGVYFAGPPSPLGFLNISLQATRFDANSAPCAGAHVAATGNMQVELTGCTFEEQEGGPQSADTAPSVSTSARTCPSKSGASTSLTSSAKAFAAADIWVDACSGTRLVLASSMSDGGEGDANDGENGTLPELNSNAPALSSSPSSALSSYRVEYGKDDCPSSSSNSDSWWALVAAILFGVIAVLLTLLLLLQVARTWRLKNRLLRKALPSMIAMRLQRGERVVDSYEHATIVFADIVGYTAYSSKVTAEEVVTLLDTIFHRFDIECEECQCLKVKTIGDCYMAASGCLPDDKLVDSHNSSLFLLRGTLFGWHMINAMQDFRESTGIDLSIRVGLHQGKVTAGVLGKQRLQYDCFGDTVNVASRMESSSEPNKITMELNTAQRLQAAYPQTFIFGPPSRKSVKGKGEMLCCVLHDIRMDPQDQLRSIKSMSSTKALRRRQYARAQSFRDVGLTAGSPTVGSGGISRLSPSHTRRGASSLRFPYLRMASLWRWLTKSPLADELQARRKICPCTESAIMWPIDEDRSQEHLVSPSSMSSHGASCYLPLKTTCSQLDLQITEADHMQLGNGHGDRDHDGDDVAVCERHGAEGCGDEDESNWAHARPTLRAAAYDDGHGYLHKDDDEVAGKTAGRGARVHRFELERGPS